MQDKIFTKNFIFDFGKNYKIVDIQTKVSYPFYQPVDFIGQHLHEVRSSPELYIQYSVFWIFTEIVTYILCVTINISPIVKGRGGFGRHLLAKQSFSIV